MKHTGGAPVDPGPSRSSLPGEDLVRRDRSRDRVKRVAVIIPTYNERENIAVIVSRIQAAMPGADVMVVDDNSPDGTGLIAEQLAYRDSRIHVLHRTRKNGLGAAYIAGFCWALDGGFDVIVEMDADGSHRPEQLPKLLDALEGADFVIGSRWVTGGEVRNWPRSRQLLSKSGNAYARIALGIGLRDSTGGYRAYRSTALRQIGLGEVRSQGYCFQVDLALRALQSGLSVVEVPILFEERLRGTSKMSRLIVAEALWRITRWGIALRWRSVTGAPAKRESRLQPTP